MKSKTSFYSLLLKDITRFSPLWGSWLVVLLVIYLRRPSDIYYTLTYPVFLYAGICAVTLFGDLYNRRRCNALHAFPLRREAWFLIHSLAGLLFFLVPAFLFYTAVALIRATPDLWLRSLGAYAAFSLEFLCFFGIALLCAMLAGTKLGAGLIYCAISFLAPVVKFLLQQLYQPFLPSIPVELAFFDYLSPVVRMAQRIPGYYAMMGCTLPSNVFYMWDTTNLGYFLICAGVGILAAGLALLLYRQRKLEKAGFFCVYPALRYVFVTVFSLIAGTLLFQLLSHNRDQFYFLFLYIPVFYFVAAMVTEKRFHVFRKGHILTLCIFAALLFNSIWIVRYDALGILDYVPKAKQVRSVEVYVQDSDIIGTDTYYYQENLFSVPGRRVVAYEDIEQVTQVHEKLLRHRAFYGESCMVYMTYTLKSGIRVRRYYPCPRPLENDTFDLLNQAVSTRDSVFGDVLWEDYVNQVYKIEVSTVRGGNRAYWFGTPENTADATPGIVKIHSRQLQNAFLTALKKSCDDGCLLQLSYDDFTVKVFSQDHWGKEQVLTFSIPCIGNAATPLLTIFEDTARKLPDKTITDDTPLESYDLVFNADGTFIKIPREDLLP